jgi:O-antigen/teichoic acid export membrane protein
LSKQVVGRGALFIYFETLISMFSGFVFWIIMSKVSTPNAIGISSTMVSLVTIFSTIASIGIPLGIQRFLGKSFSEKKENIAKEFVKASFILSSLGILACSIVFLLLHERFYQLFNLDFSLLVVSIILIASTTIMTLFRSIVVSSLKTKMLPLIMIVGAIVKIILAYILVLNGYGALGITLGFTFFPILGTIFYTIIILKVIKSKGKNSEGRVLKYYKEVFISSVVNWIPTIIYTMGSHLGTLLVFGSHGSIEAGIYFISFSLSMAITALMSALFTIAYPILSAMSDGRKRFAWRTIKISLIISLPFSFAVIFYSKEILSVFGPSYISGSTALGVLLLSIMPIAITTGINNLSYSYGKYRQVLIIGLASNIPRAILYFSLVPSLEGVGAAISYTVGSIVGFIVSLIYSEKNNLIIIWKDITYIIIIPILILAVLFLFHLNYILGIITSMAFSYMLFIKLKVLTPSDLKDSINILPYKISNSFLWLIDNRGKKNKS